MKYIEIFCNGQQSLENPQRTQGESHLFRLDEIVCIRGLDSKELERAITWSEPTYRTIQLKNHDWQYTITEEEYRRVMNILKEEK